MVVAIDVHASAGHLSSVVQPLKYFNCANLCGGYKCFMVVKFHGWEQIFIVEVNCVSPFSWDVDAEREIVLLELNYKYLSVP